MAAVRWDEELKVTAKDLRNGLAAAVQGVQWSYAIFWAPSASQQGVLEWQEGYYNGDIKTRKMTQSLEMEEGRMGTQRSEQLRQLYISLSAGDSDQLARRPSILLSPEDLADSEWFYLLCMSFTFHPGHGLVGRTFAAGTHIWLTNAHSAESKVFTRSLLAKSASIQTVFTFPFLNGVLELGTTESAREDPDLIRLVKNFFWESLKVISAEKSTSNGPVTEEHVDAMPQKCNLDALNSVPAGILQASGPRTELREPYSLGFNTFPPLEASEMDADGDEEPEEVSPGLFADTQTDESAMMDEAVGVSQSHSWQFLDDEPVTGPKQERTNSVNDPKACPVVDFSAVDAGTEDIHYRRTLEAIFENSNRAGTTLFFPGGPRSSSFVAWRKVSNGACTRVGSKAQILLKKILFNRSEVCDGGQRPSLKEGEKCGIKGISSEKKERMNKDFRILKSLLPSIDKMGKSSILGDTIEYLKELERRVEFLESHMDAPDLEVKELSKPVDVTERTSDNYGREGVNSDGKKSSICKRKASDADEQGFETHWVLSKGGEADVNVTIVGKEVMIQVTCPWRDCLLLEVVDVVSSLHLDAHSVHSSTVDGNLELTIKSKLRGGVVTSPGMIKGKIHRVVSKC